MKTRTIVAGAITLALVSAGSLAHAKPMTCAVVTTKQIEALFDRWNASLATLDSAKVTANDASDAVLLPTVSNTPRTDSASIQSYFVDFLKKHPQGKIDTRTVKIGCNMASDVGTYTFTLSGKSPSDTQIVKARYRYVYVYRDKKWLIAHHHSSVMPEPVTPAAATTAPNRHQKKRAPSGSAPLTFRRA
jgi:uncharacterized protein (TIGR02246 family)